MKGGAGGLSSFMKGDFERKTGIIVFRPIFRSNATMIWPDGLRRSHLLVLDIDLRPGLSFSHEGRFRFHA